MDSPRKATNYPRRAATPAASDKHLWARSYERELRDVLLLQSEVARAIADEIQVKITPQERLRLTTTRVVDPAAHGLRVQHISVKRVRRNPGERVVEQAGIGLGAYGAVD